MSKDFKEMLKNEKTKKAAVFASLGMLFAVSMYMIFAPAEKTGDDGLGENSINATVPQAAGSNLTDDKLKIYEFGTETKEEERRKFAGTLAQLQEDSIHVAMEERNEYRQDNLVQDSHIDRSVQQYKKTSEALASFYDNGQDSEKEGLLEEIERLNGEIQRMKTAENDEEDQLALLEKSYQMAAKYLPLNGNGNHVPTSGKKNDEAKNTEVAYEVLPDNRQVVSCLVQPGADGKAKMSKSLGNCIYLADTEEDVRKKVMSMYTDPNHIRVEDPGQIEGNTVFTYLDAFCKEEYFAEFLPDYANLDELKAHYQRGGLGDVKVKKFLNTVMQAELAPIRERRKQWEKDIPAVYEILKKGSEEAKNVAAKTLDDVKKAMKINYFDDGALINEHMKKYMD